MKDNFNQVTAFSKKWLSGIPDEIKFWDKWFSSLGLAWPEEYQRRINPNPEFTLENFISNPLGNNIKVLDVGSGPISPVGINSTKWNICLEACDPLSPFYAKLFIKYNIKPYVIPKFAYAESLVDCYESESFDIVHMSNALDHSIMPLECLKNMIEVAKIGGKIILVHNENEAENESYAGFHQWNISIEDNNFILWNKNEKINVNLVLGEYCVINSEVFNSGSNFNIIRINMTRINHKRVVTRNKFKSLFDEVLILHLIESN